MFFVLCLSLFVNLISLVLLIGICNFLLNMQTGSDMQVESITKLTTEVMRRLPNRAFGTSEIDG